MYYYFAERRYLKYILFFNDFVSSPEITNIEVNQKTDWFVK